MRHGLSSAMTSSFSDTIAKPTLGTRAHSLANKQSASGHGRVVVEVQQCLLVNRFPRSVAEPHLHAHDADKECRTAEGQEGTQVVVYSGL